MTVLTLDALTKRYRRGDQAAVDSLSLRVQRGEVFALLGESGSGKTTTLRLIAGFEVPTSGAVRILSRTVADASTFVPPERRGVRMVFQESALFPHLTVEGNLRFAVPGLGRSARRRRVAAVLSTVNLEGLDSRYPHELSGGQRQRVELARALISQPDLLLLDEPFSNLDVSLRTQLRAEIADILRATGTTSILVTHDVEDAFTVSDRVAVLKDGALQQVGTPREVYLAPVNAYVARFFGSVNLLAGRPTKAGVETAFGTVPIDAETQDPEHSVLLCVRPECFELADDSSPVFSGRVEKTTFLGRFQEVCLRPAQPADDEKPGPLRLVIHLPAEIAVQPGQRLALRPKPGMIRKLP